MIARFHKYLWYRLYKFNLQSWKDPIPALGQTTAALCGLIYWYGITVLLWVSAITGIPFFYNYALQPKWQQLVFGGIIFATILVVWAPNGRYKKVIQEFDSLGETREQRIARAFYLWLYVFVWVLLFVGGIMLNR